LSYIYYQISFVLFSGWTAAGHGLLHPEDGARQNGEAERRDQRQQIIHRKVRRLSISQLKQNFY
jgi:hypothetical protein